MNKFEPPDSVTVPAQMVDPQVSGVAGWGLMRVLKNAGWLFVGKGVGAILSLAYLAIATRTLGRSGFGDFALVLATAQSVVALVSFQTWQIMIRFGMPHWHNGDTFKLQNIIGLCIALDLASATAGAILAVGGIALIGPTMGWSAQTRIEATLFALVMLVSVRSTPTGILRMVDRFGKGAIGDATIPVVRLLGALVVLAIGPSVTRFLIAWGVAEIAAAIMYWHLARGAVPLRSSALRPARIRETFRALPGFTGFAGATNLASSLNAVSKQLGVVAIGMIVGPVAAGGYRLVYQLSQSLVRLSEMLSRALFAELARAQHHAEESGLIGLFHRTSRLSFMLAAAAVVIAVVAGKPILHLVAGAAFVDAYPLLVVLGVSAAFELAGTGFEPLLLATGHARAALRYRAMATVVMVSAFALLTPTYGVIGAAFAVLAGTSTSFALLGLAARRGIRDNRTL